MTPELFYQGHAIPWAFGRRTHFSVLSEPSFSSILGLAECESNTPAQRRNLGNRSGDRSNFRFRLSSIREMEKDLQLQMEISHHLSYYSIQVLYQNDKWGSYGLQILTNLADISYEICVGTG